MTAGAPDDLLVPHLGADILAIVGGPDRAAHRGVWRSKAGTVGVGAALILATVGVGLAFQGDRSELTLPDVRPSRVVEVFRSDKQIITRAVPPRVVRPSFRRGGARFDGGGEDVSATTGDTVDLVSKSAEPTSAASAAPTVPITLPSSLKQPVEARKERGNRYVSPGPERRDAGRSMVSPLKNMSRSAALSNPAETFPEQLDPKKRGILETRDAIRDLRLR